jgi:glycosyltransferase involved in cell wall biosynthesis
MIEVGQVILTDDIKDEYFVCDLAKCKGGCCVEGDLGAPLLEDELGILDDIYPEVKPFLNDAGRAAIEKQGRYILDEDNEFSTPTIDGKECAYAIYDDAGILKCGIEMAYLEGKIDPIAPGYQKPISCHLYPLRIKRYEQFEAVNYDRWHICKDACTNGMNLKVPLYKFLRKPLVRKYGEEWYAELVQVIEEEQKVKKVLFIGMHRPNRSPSQRYRFEQYFTFLEQDGIQCHLSYLISDTDDQILYQRGHYLAKLKIFIKSILKRRKDLREANEYDYIYIQREAFMTGSTYFERKLSKSKAQLIFDFDDAIWLEDKSSHYGILSRLKRPAKTSEIIAMANKVIAGNTYLSEYGSQFNNNVQIIPTTIDTEWYLPKEKVAKSPVVIGWSGSFSTIKHFEQIIPVLLKINNKFKEKVGFKVIGDATYLNPELEIRGINWQAKTEVHDLQELDIGIMPLPDEEWTMGKCGAKGLQYMGLAIPTIMSPVGVNKEIIEDGVNGFLAETPDEWIDKLSLLIESPELRMKLGNAGRETVVKHYSVNANKQKYLDLFR